MRSRRTRAERELRKGAHSIEMEGTTPTRRCSRGASISGLTCKAKSFVTRIDQRGRVLEQVYLPHATGALQRDLARVPRSTFDGFPR